MIAGRLPVERGGVLLVKRPIILPLAGAQTVMAMSAQPGQMLGGTSAAIGNEQQIVGQLEELLQEVILLLDAGVPIAIAVVEMTGDRDGAEIIDDGGQPELQQLVLALIAARDVSGRIPELVDEEIEGPLRPRFGVLVSAVEDEMRGIEMATFEVELGEPQHRAGDLGEDGVAMLEESVEGAGESIIVEFVGGNVAEIFDAMLGGPVGDVDQSGGMIEPSRQEDLEDGAVRELGLGIGGDVSIDDVGDVEFVEQWDQNTERGKINDGLFARRRLGEIGHDSSVKRESLGKMERERPNEMPNQGAV